MCSEYNGVLYPLKNQLVSEPDGIEITLKTTDYISGELFMLASKKPTVGILSNVNVGKSYLKGEEFKVLSANYREIVGPKGFTMGQVITSKNSKVNSPKDLVGKKIGIQGMADGSTIAMMTSLRKIHNLDLDEIEFVVVESNMAPILVNEGKLDAAMFDSDYIMTSDFNEHYKMVFDFNKDMFDFYGTVPPSSFFVVKKSFYDKNPEAYDKVITYFTSAYSWYKNNLEEVSKLEAAEHDEDWNLIYEKAGYEERGGHVSEKDIAAYYDFYETAKLRGVIDEVPDLKKIFITN